MLHEVKMTSHKCDDNFDILLKLLNLNLVFLLDSFRLENALDHLFDQLWLVEKSA